MIEFILDKLVRLICDDSQIKICDDIIALRKQSIDLCEQRIYIKKQRASLNREILNYNRSRHFIDHLYACRKEMMEDQNLTIEYDIKSLDLLLHQEQTRAITLNMSVDRMKARLDILNAEYNAEYNEFYNKYLHYNNIIQSIRHNTIGQYLVTK